MMIGSFFALMFYILAPVEVAIYMLFEDFRCDDDVEIQQKQASLCWP